jgi:hypothetical protein
VRISLLFWIRRPDGSPDLPQPHTVTVQGA